jgi:hypothetical protein
MSSSGSEDDTGKDRGRESKKVHKKKSSESVSKTSHETEFDVDIDTTTPEWKKELLTKYIQLEADELIDTNTNDDEENSISLESLSISDVSECLDIGKLSIHKSMNFIVAKQNCSPRNRSGHSSSVHDFDSEWTRLKELELPKHTSSSDEGYESLMSQHTMDTFTSPTKKSPNKVGKSNIIMDLSPQHKNTSPGLSRSNSYGISVQCTKMVAAFQKDNLNRS